MSINTDFASDSPTTVAVIDHHDDDFCYESSPDDHHQCGDKVHLVNRAVPKDRYGIAYIIFYILGVSTMLPWNFLITANDYWMYKFRNVSVPFDLNGTTNHNHTHFQVLFTSYLCIASVVPNTIFLILNALFAHKIHHQTRLVSSYTVILLLFIFITALVKVDTDCWQMPFFGITLATVVLMNIMSAVQQGAIFGILGKFPSKYMAGMVGGQALAGVFASVANIISEAIGASPINCGFAFFLIANAALVVSFAAYLILSRMEFFLYYCEGRNVQNELLINDTVTTVDASTPPISYWQILKKIRIYAFCVGITFMVTLSVFPSVIVLTVSEKSGTPWNDTYFVPVMSFLVFNMGDFLGRIIGSAVKWPRKGSPLLLLFGICRIVFIPLFLFCNIQPRKHPAQFPVLFGHNVQYCAILAAFSLSNGYIATLNFMYAPMAVTSTEQETASSMMATFLGIGVTIGVLLSSELVVLP